jgi:hypothetical protein
LWLCTAQVYAYFLHYSEHFGMDSLTRLRASRHSLSFQGICQSIEKGGSHLRPSSIVYASEYHFQHILSLAYEQHLGPQQGADETVACFGLMAYTLTLAAAAFTSYFPNRSDSSSCKVVGGGAKHVSSAIAGEQHPDWFSTLA